MYGQYSRAVSNQERVIVARVRYITQYVHTQLHLIVLAVFPCFLIDIYRNDGIFLICQEEPKKNHQGGPNKSKQEHNIAIRSLATPCPIFSRDFHFHSDFDSRICRLRRQRDQVQPNEMAYQFMTTILDVLMIFR